MCWLLVGRGGKRVCAFVCDVEAMMCACPSLEHRRRGQRSAQSSRVGRAQSTHRAAHHGHSVHSPGSSHRAHASAESACTAAPSTPLPSTPRPRSDSGGALEVVAFSHSPAVMTTLCFKRAGVLRLSPFLLSLCLAVTALHYAAAPPHRLSLVVSTNENDLHGHRYRAQFDVDTGALTSPWPFPAPFDVSYPLGTRHAGPAFERGPARLPVVALQGDANECCGSKYTLAAINESEHSIRFPLTPFLTVSENKQCIFWDDEVGAEVAFLGRIGATIQLRVLVHPFDLERRRAV